MGNYNESGEIPSQHTNWASLVRNIPRLLKKVFYGHESNSRAGERAMGRLEQRNVFWMRDPMRIAIKAGNFVTELCAVTSSTAKACKLLD